MRTVLKGRVNLFQGHSPENPLLTGTESYGTVIVLLVKAWVGNDLLKDCTGSLPRMWMWTPTPAPTPPSSQPLSIEHEASTRSKF